MHTDLLFNRLNKTVLKVFGDGNLGMDLSGLSTDVKTDILAALNEIYGKEQNITKQIGDTIRAKFSTVTDAEIMAGTAANSLVDSINKFFTDVKREIMVKDSTPRTVAATTSSVTILDGDANPLPAQRATTDDQEGVIVQAGKNKCTIWDASTHDEIITADGHVVYGIIERNGTDDGYVISLKYFDGTTEQDYVVSADTSIEFAFPQRFNLLNLPASSMRTSYFNRVADISEELNLQQLAKDIYTTPSLDGDGNANLGQPLQTSVANLTGEVDNIENSLGTAIAGDGSFAGYSGTNYINGSRSISEADILLDSQLKTVADQVSTLSAEQSSYFRHAFIVPPDSYDESNLDANGIVTSRSYWADSTKAALLMEYTKTYDSQGKITQEIYKEYDGSGADAASSTLLRTTTITYDYSQANKVIRTVTHI